MNALLLVCLSVGAPVFALICVEGPRKGVKSMDFCP
jgi:hypothetical protein